MGYKYCTQLIQPTWIGPDVDIVCVLICRNDSAGATVILIQEYHHRSANRYLALNTGVSRPESCWFEQGHTCCSGWGHSCLQLFGTEEAFQSGRADYQDTKVQKAFE